MHSYDKPGNPTNIDSLVPAIPEVVLSVVPRTSTNERVDIVPALLEAVHSTSSKSTLSAKVTRLCTSGIIVITVMVTPATALEMLRLIVPLLGVATVHDIVGKGNPLAVQVYSDSISLSCTVASSIEMNTEINWIILAKKKIIGYSNTPWPHLQIS